MIDTRLILVDGLTGAGKSTTAQRLWLHLERCGVAARWFYEHDGGHPIWPADEPQALAAHGELPAGFLAHTLPARWRRLAGDAAGSDTCTVVESALMQTTGALLLAMNVAEDEVVRVLCACAEAAAPARPALLWLHPGDVATSLRATCDERRQDDYERNLIALLGATPYGRRHGLAGFAALVRFYETWLRVCERACAQMALPVLALPPAPWSEREQRITEFLGLPPLVVPRQPLQAAERFTGRYRAMGAEDVLALGGDEHGLVLDGPRPTPLIAQGEATFIVTALPLQLTFEDERDGRFQRLALHSRLPGLQACWQRLDADAEARP